MGSSGVLPTCKMLSTVPLSSRQLPLQKRSVLVLVVLAGAPGPSSRVLFPIVSVSEEMYVLLLGQKGEAQFIKGKNDLI